MYIQLTSCVQGESSLAYDVDVALEKRPGKLCGNFTISQNFHTRKLGEVLVFYVVIFKIFNVCSGVQEFISTHFALCGRRDSSSVLKLQTEIRRLQKILKS